MLVVTIPTYYIIVVTIENRKKKILSFIPTKNQKKMVSLSLLDYFLAYSPEKAKIPPL